MVFTSLSWLKNRSSVALKQGVHWQISMIRLKPYHSFLSSHNIKTLCQSLNWLIFSKSKYLWQYRTIPTYPSSTFFLRMFSKIFMAENWSYTLDTSSVECEEFLCCCHHYLGVVAMQLSLKLSKYRKLDGLLWFHQHSQCHPQTSIDLRSIF